MKRFLNREPDTLGKFKSRRVGEVKVSKLSHVRAKACYPRLSWIMFHRIFHMYYAAFKLKTVIISKSVNNEKSELEMIDFNVQSKDSVSEISTLANDSKK